MTEIQVHLDLADGPVPAGSADVTTARGVTTTRFTYERTYLAGVGWDLSPDLPVVTGGTVTEGLPGAFEDSSPDAWGRNLITRRLARKWAGHGTPTPTEIDFLLGVSDFTRQGALRFSVGDGFLAEAGEVPQLIELERLLDAATAVVEDGAEADEAVAELLDAGSGSLGGARPKASVTDGDALLIAKFAHPADRWDVIRWEAVTLDLAEACGLTVPVRRLELIGSRPVLVVQRFDRRRVQRIPYLSARSLIAADTGPGDYLELVEGIADHGSNVEADLHQLWRRLAFSIAFNNTDDHLRNHGFLRHRGGWQLSPMFDVNPDPDPDARRATSIRGETSPMGCQRALIKASEEFWLDPSEAEDQWTEVVAALASWRDVATARGLPAEELERFAPALDRWAAA